MVQIRCKEDLNPLYEKGQILEATGVIVGGYTVGKVTISADLVEVIPKRDPLEDGTLPLTEKELEEFSALSNRCIQNKEKITHVRKDNLHVMAATLSVVGHKDEFTVTEYRAILWLDKLFNLGAIK